MKFMGRLLPFCMLALALTATAYAQNGAITGKVIDADGNPMAGVTVTLDRVEIKQHFEVKTDKNGSYMYNGLPIGTYRVTVVKDGQTISAVDGIPIKSGNQTPVDIDLRKSAAAAGAGAAADKAKVEDAKKKQADTHAAFQAGLDAMQTKNPDGTTKKPDYQTAADKFQEAANLDPTQHVIFAQLGGALDGLRKYPEAVEAYKKAIELKPDEAGYYNNLGIEYGRSGKVDDATAAMQKAAELNPTGAGQYYYNLGAILINAGHTKEATAAFQKAIEVKPDMNEAYYQLGISLMADTTKIPDSINALQKYIDLQKTGGNVEAARQMIDALKAQAPTGYSNPDASKSKTKGKTPNP